MQESEPQSGGVYSRRSVPTEQELSVLLAVVEQGGVKRAARELALSASTIHTYLARLRARSGQSTHAQLLLWAMKNSNAVRSKFSEAQPTSEPEIQMKPLVLRWNGLSDAQWAVISPQIPAEKSGPGRHQLDRRVVLNGILYKLRTGASWGKLPSEFGLRGTCSRCYHEWLKSGNWKAIWRQFYSTLSQSERLEWGLLVLESGCIPEIPVR